jgi:phospholipid/cholesterol/gamma-HCH transport system substrate-binding protein
MPWSLIGDKFIKITPGGSDVYLQNGGEIIETEPSINLEELISKYIFESGDK